MGCREKFVGMQEKNTLIFVGNYFQHHNPISVLKDKDILK